MSEVAEAGLTQQARDLLITKWLDAKKAFVEAQELERSLRADVVAEMFPQAVKGTNRYQLGNGFALKYVRTIKYTLGDKELIADGVKVPISDQVEHLQDTIDALGAEAVALNARLIRWTPELSSTEYNKLDESFPIQEQIKKLVDAMLTTGDGSPTLELETPKAK